MAKDTFHINNSGFVTGEFIFALTLAAGFCLLLFALTFTLSMIEISQYVAFSTARAHMASHIDQDKQLEQGRKKFQILIKNPVLAALFSEKGVNWFTLSLPEIRGGGESNQDFESEYGNPVPNRVPSTGVRMSLTSKVLNFKLPFLGRTAPDEDQGFQTRLTAFLFREPNMKECQNQINSRYQMILDLDSRFQDLAGKTLEKYLPLEDNGC